MKENILNEASKGGSGDTSNVSNDGTYTITSATTYATVAITRSSDVYIYGVGVVGVLSRGACVFFAYIKTCKTTGITQYALDLSMQW